MTTRSIARQEPPVSEDEQDFMDASPEPTQFEAAVQTCNGGSQLIPTPTMGMGYHASCAKPPKLRTFNGIGDVAEFIRETRLLLKLQPMPEGQATTWILAALTGRAKEKLLTRQDHEISSPTRIFAILKEDWGDMCTPVSKKCKFYARKQEQDESVMDFAHGLRKLHSKVRGLLSEEELSEVFIEGIRINALRRDLRRSMEMDYLSFDELLQVARKWIKEEERDQDVSRSMHSIRTLKLDDKSELESGMVPQQNSSGMRQERRFQLRCFWCKRLGHKARNCEEKKRYHQRETRQEEGPLGN